MAACLPVSMLLFSAGAVVSLRRVAIVWSEDQAVCTTVFLKRDEKIRGEYYCVIIRLLGLC